MWSHPHPNPLPKGEGDLDPFVAGFGAVHFAAGFAGLIRLSRVALAVDEPQRYISLIRFSAVVATRMVVGVAGRCRNPSRIGSVRDMLS